MAKRIAIILMIGLMIISGCAVTVLGFRTYSRHVREFTTLGCNTSELGANLAEQVMENAIDNGILDFATLFSRSYEPVGENEPRRFRSGYDLYLDRRLLLFADAFLDAEPIHYAYLVANDGYIALHTNPARSKLLTTPPSPHGHPPTGRYCGVYTDPQGHTYHEYTQPVYVYRRHWGQFRVGIPVALIKAEAREIVLRSMAVMTLISAILATLLYFVVHRSLRPLKDLAATTARMGAGDLTVRADYNGRNELGDLARAFNAMAEHIETDHKTLEDRVRARTAELGDANTKLRDGIARRTKAEQEARALKQQIEFILGATKTGIDVIDAEFNVRYIDPEWRKVYGDPAGKKCYEYFMGRSEPCPDCGVITALETKEICVTEELLVKENNRPVQVTTMPFRNDKGEWLVAEVNTDITERKQNEDALRKSHRELIEVTTKLNRSNHDLQDFVYIASHDLREPLRKISSFGNLLKESLDGQLSEDDQENLNFLTDGADRMDEMVQGLLTYSRVTTRKKSLDPVDLNETVHQLRGMEVAALLEDAGAALEVPQALPTVAGDPVQIRQLLQNLITNAVKYRRKGVTPRVEIRPGHTDDGQPRIEVADNGIGIPDEMRNDIFVMFRRLHSRRQYTGSGIGLAVCKRIVERHGGRIGVESKLGQGSTFWFTLETSDPAHTHADPQPAGA